MTQLRQRMTDDMTVRGLAENTKKSYLNSVAGLARHYRRRPDRISAPEVQDYLLHLHEQKGLTWQSCNCVRHGVRFLYRITLGLPDPHFYLPGAKTPSTLPRILNRDELVRLFTVTTNRKHRALLMTAYAAGLRASELGRLQLSDIDSERMCLRVDQGKGNKDRYVPLSPRLLDELREYWRRHRPRHWLFPSDLRSRPMMTRAGPAHIYTEITRKRIRRGVFESVAELEQAIYDYLAIHNHNPVPFVWTATATAILEKPPAPSKHSKPSGREPSVRVGTLGDLLHRQRPQADEDRRPVGPGCAVYTPPTARHAFRRTGVVRGKRFEPPSEVSHNSYFMM